MAEGIRWDDFEEGLAAIRDVGPGGHYLGHQHTMDNFQRAFFMLNYLTITPLNSGKLTGVRTPFKGELRGQKNYWLITKNQNLMKVRTKSFLTLFKEERG